ncbi:MAG: MBG domain-containing protein, partial [Verrucomicrobia bacterium]|nr:MBG domain-containing protein [Verrucomicrobiota bacterium]
LDNLTHTYDGTAKVATATTTPVDLTVNLTYDGSPTAPADAGSYVLAATINEVNYVGSATGTLVIRPANDWASWCNHYFTELEQSAGLADDNADPDADGWVNLAEYALGTNPRQFTPPLVPMLDAHGLALTFTRPANLPGVTYAAESSDDLDTWSPVPLHVLESGTTETVRVLDPLTTGDPSRRFLRLRFGR